MRTHAPLTENQPLASCGQAVDKRKRIKVVRKQADLLPAVVMKPVASPTLPRYTLIFLHGMGEVAMSDMPTGRALRVPISGDVGFAAPEEVLIPTAPLREISCFDTWWSKVKSRDVKGGRWRLEKFNSWHLGSTFKSKLSRCRDLRGTITSATAVVAKRLQSDDFQSFFAFQVPEDAIDIDSLHRTQESLHEIIAREARGSAEELGGRSDRCLGQNRNKKSTSLLNFLTSGSHFQIKAISGSSFKLLAEVAWPHALCMSDPKSAAAFLQLQAGGEGGLEGCCSLAWMWGDLRALFFFCHEITLFAPGATTVWGSKVVFCAWLTQKGVDQGTAASADKARDASPFYKGAFSLQLWEAFKSFARVQLGSADLSEKAVVPMFHCNFHPGAFSRWVSFVFGDPNAGDPSHVSFKLGVGGLAGSAGNADAWIARREDDIMQWHWVWISVSKMERRLRSSNYNVRSFRGKDPEGNGHFVGGVEGAWIRKSLRMICEARSLTLTGHRDAAVAHGDRNKLQAEQQPEEETGNQVASGTGAALETQMASSEPTKSARDIALVRSTYRRARTHYSLRKKDVAKRCELFHLAAQSIFAGVSEVFQERKRIAGLVLRAVATEKCRHDMREQMEEGFLKRLGRPKLKAPESRRFKAIFDSADELLLNNFPLAGEAMCKALFCTKEEFAERSQGLGNLLRCQSTLQSNIRTHELAATILSCLSALHEQLLAVEAAPVQTEWTQWHNAVRKRRVSRELVEDSVDAGDPGMSPEPVQAQQTAKVEVAPLPRLPPSLSVTEVLPALQPSLPSVSDARSLSSSGHVMKSPVRDVAKEDQAAKEASAMLPGGPQTFDFSGPLEVPGRRTSLQAQGSKPAKGQKSARLVGPGLAQEEDLADLSAEMVLEATLRLPVLTSREPKPNPGGDADAAPRQPAEPLEPLEPLEPQRGTLPTMRMSSTFKGEAEGLTAHRKKRWKRERMRALMVTSQSISGVPMEWILPVVADASVRQIQKFNSPADIGARLKSRNLHGRSRKSAASIPINKGTFFPALC
ncbi:unnamed protein product [Symbiodinium sp. CCMP2456]|nr:unnamed protein product [Symbiodinium sp. CCMP2456]